MLLTMAQAHLRMTTRSYLQTRAKAFYPTKSCRSGFGFASGPSSASSSSPNLMKHIALASAFSITGLWAFVTTRNDTANDDAPNLDSSPAEHWDAEPGPSKDQVTHLISQGAYSHRTKNVAGVSRYDGAQLASNSPCEDQFTHGQFPSPFNEDQKSQWMAWGVFDGHLGSQTAELLKKQLLPFVRHSLLQVKPGVNKSLPEKSVQNTIMKGFVTLDDSIIKSAVSTSQSEDSLQEKVKKLAPAFAGSCALLSIYDSITRTLHVACTGDSRAVLGRKRPDGRWEAIPLSVDQTGNNKEEIARLNREHPGEESIVKNGRILGIMVSRAFGDSQWKWPLEFQQDMQQRFHGPSPLTPRYDVKTPPYLTAEPVVTSTKIEPGTPSFLIMATDGLWDMLSNEQAVDLVGKWLESGAVEKSSINPEPRYEPFDFGQFWNGMDWKFVEERTTIQDDNAAVHLMRNSLGGNHHELIAARLAFSPPASRRVRDDMTVQVVFFNTPDLENK